MTPRVFVSSVMEGYSHYREAARSGIEAAGGEPVLVEDYPSLPSSPRNACLDGVASCDILILIIGERGGWTAPSGKLVVEEEYEEAQREHLPVVVFLQEIQRDDSAERLAQFLSSYVTGLYRRTFRTADELRAAVEEALRPLIEHHQQSKVDQLVIDQALDSPFEIPYETTLRVVVAPERVDEFLDPVLLESPELQQQLYEIGHAPTVGLFSYGESKQAKVGINEIVMLQECEQGNRDALAFARLEVTTRGLIVTDVNVTGLRPTDFGVSSYDDSSVYEDDVASGLRRCFGFARAFLDARDTYHRYGRLLYNAALAGLGMRMLRKEPPKGGGCPVGQYGDSVFRAFDQARIVTRQELSSPENLIEAVLTMFRRRLRD